MPDDHGELELDWEWAEEAVIRHVPTPAPDAFEEERPTSPRSYSLLELAASIGDRVGTGESTGEVKKKTCKVSETG